MSSLRTGATLCCSYNTRARNQCVDFDTSRYFIIVPNPDDDVFVDEPTMATASKSPSALAHASAEKIAPQTSAVINWVHQQSQHDQPPGAAKATRRVQMATPPQIKTKVVGSSSDHGRPRRLVYEAATLLKLRNTQCAVPVMLRVKPEAIAGMNLHLEPSNFLVT